MFWPFFSSSKTSFEEKKKIIECYQLLNPMNVGPNEGFSLTVDSLFNLGSTCIIITPQPSIYMQLINEATPS